MTIHHTKKPEQVYLLAAEYDVHAMYDSEDLIFYLAQVYKKLDQCGKFVLSNYPKELFEETDYEV